MQKKNVIMALLVTSSILVGQTAVAQESDLDAGMPGFTSIIEDASPESGEELFEAIYFGTGDKAPILASKLNLESFTSIVETIQDTSLDTSEYEQLAADKTHDIAVDDTDFMVDFYEKTTSGNPILVESAISNGYEKLESAIPNANDEDGFAGEDRANPASLVALIAAAVYAAVVWDAAFAINYVALVNVEGHVNVHQKTNFSVSKWGEQSRSVLNGDDGTASKEKAIASVTEAFSR